MLYDKKWDQQLTPAAAFDPTGKILLAAADYIEEHGWCQETYENDEGAVCALGAIRRTCFYDEHQGALAYVFYNNAERRLGEHLCDHNIALWNDNCDQTKENVIKTLRQAAKQAMETTTHAV